MALGSGWLKLLQSRPITKLIGAPDSDRAQANYSGVTMPLTYSFAHHVRERVYREPRPHGHLVAMRTI